MYDRGERRNGFTGMRKFSLSGDSTSGDAMDRQDGQASRDSAEAIESLARSVAHLAVQVTIAQLQLRALGQVLESANLAGSDVVADATASLARSSAGRFLSENLGPELAGLIDLDDLESQVIAYLSARG